jgi:hypothetical protein
MTLLSLQRFTSRIGKHFPFLTTSSSSLEDIVFIMVLLVRNLLCACFSFPFLCLIRSTVGIVPYFATLGYPCAPHTNPGDHVISLINVDFHSTSQLDIGDKPSPVASTQDRLSHIVEAWRTRNPSDSRNNHADHTVHPNSNGAGIADNTITSPFPKNLSPEGLPHLIRDPSAIWAARDRHRLSDEANRIRLLMQRAVLNYRRNLLAYGIRIAMYGMFGTRTLGTSFLDSLLP